MKKSNAFIGIRVPAKLKKELEREARALNITLSAYIKLLLQGTVKRNDGS